MCENVTSGATLLLLLLHARLCHARISRIELARERVLADREQLRQFDVEHGLQSTCDVVVNGEKSS